MRVHVDSTFKVFDGRQCISAIGPDASHLERVLGATGCRSGHTAEHLLGSINVATGTHGPGLAKCRVDLVVAVFAGVFESLSCCVVVAQGRQHLSVKEDCHAVLLYLAERCICLFVLRQQVACDSGAGKQ